MRALGLGIGMGMSNTHGPPPFDPTIYSGCTLDLDAAVGYAAGTWTDQSGAGHDATQGTGANRPTATTVGDFAALDFDGSNDVLSGVDITTIISTSAYAVFAVVYIDAIDSNTGFGTHEDGILVSQSGRFGLTLRSTPLALVAHYDGAFKEASRTVATGAITLVAGRFKTGNIYVSVDGTDSAGTATTGFDALAGNWDIGLASQESKYFDGKILRLIAYNVALADADWAAAKDALMAQYGIG